MGRPYQKFDFPVNAIRKYLEPGPILLVSSRWKDQTNIMTLGWHTVLEFSPSLVGCMISGGNYSFEIIKNSGECVINLPTMDMIDQVIGIGNTSGNITEKFREFNLTPEEATFVKAPLIKECFANFECRIYETQLIEDYNFFIFEVVKAHVASRPTYPKTVHYRGEGIFMISGKNISMSEKFRPENL